MSGLDLYQTQGQLLFMLAVSLAVGLGLGCVYDLLRFFRMILWPQGEPTERGNRLLWVTILFGEDVLLAVISSISVILLCYYTNDGCFRAPVAVGVAGGFFVYMRTAGRLTVKAEKALSRRLKRVVKAVLGFLRRPLGWLVSTARSLATFLKILRFCRENAHPSSKKRSKFSFSSP